MNGTDLKNANCKLDSVKVVTEKKIVLQEYLDCSEFEILAEWSKKSSVPALDNQEDILVSLWDAITNDVHMELQY